MNRAVAWRAVRQVASTSSDQNAVSRLSSSCWRCRVSSVSTLPLSSSHRLLHVSSAVQQSIASSARGRRSKQSEHPARPYTDERVLDEEGAVTDSSWSPPPFCPTPPSLSDLMEVAREGATDSAMDSPLDQTLAALVQNRDLITALNHLRSLHRTASVDSWNLLLSAFAQGRRFDDVADMWRLWQSILPTLDQPLPAGYSRLLLPNATTYGILLRSPPTHSLVTASEALAQLTGRGLPTSTFIYNTLIKEYVQAKKYTSAIAVVDQMRLAGMPQDIYTVSMRFTVWNKTGWGVEPARRYEQLVALWDDLMALKLHRIPISLGFAFVWQICHANDSRRLVQLVHAIVSASGPPDVVHQAKPVELMLGCLLKNDRLQEMIELYRYMRRVGFKMTHKHFFLLVAGFARQGETNGMMRVFNEMVGHGVQPDVTVFETMLQAHRRVGDEEAALRMIRRMSEFGVQPTIDCVCAIARGIHERQAAMKAEQVVVPDEQTGLSDAVNQREQATPVHAAWPFYAPSLSGEYLPLFELTDELNMTPAPYLYQRLLQALHEENDLSAMLFFLYDMKRKGVALCLSELQWVLRKLSQMAQTQLSAPVRLMVMQASLIVDGEESTLGALTSYYLLSMYIGVCDVASMQRIYRSLRKRGIRVFWDTYLRMIQQCLRAHSSDVREHERMQFITELYADLRASEQKLGESIYNEVLQAYAVLGDTTGMKEVLAAMRRDGVAMGEGTLAVLDEAREHVEYTADITNYVTQQRNRITTLQMESNIRMRHKAERQAAAVGSAAAAPTRLTAIDAPVEKVYAQSLFALPEWSPLYDQTEAEAEADRLEEEAATAAVEELQSALSAFLSSLPANIMHAQQFPTAPASGPLHLDEVDDSTPTAKQLSAINRKLKALRTRWPVVREQGKTRGRPQTAQPSTTGAAPATLNQLAGGGTRIQPIDAMQGSAVRPAALSSAPSLSPRTAPSSPLVPQPGHIDLSTRGSGSVRRVTRAGTIGRLPRFSIAAVGTVTARRLKAAMASKAAERSTVVAAAAAEQSMHGARSPVLPLPPANTAAAFFTAIDSRAETVAIADCGKRKRRARRTTSTSAAESGGKQRDPYHGGWTD